MAEIWYLATSFISVPHIVGSVFEPIRFLLPVCRLCWFLYTLNIYAHFSSHFSQEILMPQLWYLVTSFHQYLLRKMWWKANKIGKQEVGIWWVQKRFPRYGVPIWSLWPNIRFVASIFPEKNATKNVHICSMCIKTNKVGKQEVGIWWVRKRFPHFSKQILMAEILFFNLITYWVFIGNFHHIFLSKHWSQPFDICFVLYYFRLTDKCKKMIQKKNHSDNICYHMMTSWYL
jgi:hypothetical protein